MGIRHPAADAADAFDKSLASEAIQHSSDDSVPPQVTPPAGAAATQAPAPAAPAIDADVAALEARLAAAERERDAARDAALESTRLIQQFETTGNETVAQLRAAEERAEAAERAREEQAAQLRKLEREQAYAIDYATLETLSPEAARELDEKLLRPRLARIEDTYEQRLRDQQATFDARVKELGDGQNKLSDNQKNARLAQTNRGITTKHEDFPTLLKQREFNTFLDSRIPGSRRTYRDEMQAAYYDGDVDFVNGVLDTYKASSGAPSLAAVADAGAVRVATSPAVSTDRTYSMQEFEDMSFKFRSKQISLADWTKFKTAFAQAEAEGRVR